MENKLSLCRKPEDSFPNIIIGDYMSFGSVSVTCESGQGGSECESNADPDPGSSRTRQRKEK
jgi:hypothetical protein